MIGGDNGTGRGTTSACAENTTARSLSPKVRRNYLRVRGEYAVVPVIAILDEELPPRARRIRHQHITKIGQGGTTSACAENTPPAPQIIHAWWNYLRVRGEYRLFERSEMSPVELPPRARRIRPLEQPFQQFGGTTSACAENTLQSLGRGDAAWNYLRVRGEYFVLG